MRDKMEYSHKSWVKSSKEQKLREKLSKKNKLLLKACDF